MAMVVVMVVVVVVIEFECDLKRGGEDAGIGLCK